jgi:phosphohistidine phosphatase
MRLYLARHGDAEIPGIDPKRPLSELGRHQVENLAALLTRQNVYIEQVYHSGILRAAQTAEILGTAMKSRDVSMLEGLHPGDPVDSVGHMVADFTRETLLVGHLPFMGRMASWLVLGHSQRDVVLFDTATLACLMYVGGDHWAVEWVLNAALFV